MESTSAGELTDRLAASIEALSGWMAEFGAYPTHPSLQVAPEAFEAKQAELLQRLRDNYPFFHPRYVGQMLKPPHPAAIVGYLSAMLINPNNHALDGGPATARMEKEVVAELARMFGYPDAPRTPDQQRHDRQPRSAVRRPGNPSGQGNRVQRRRALHAQPDEPPARDDRRPPCPPTPAAGWTSTRWRTC